MKCALGVVRECYTAAGENRNAARLRHLFDEQNFCSRIMRGDCRDSARGAESDDDDVDFFVPISIPSCRVHQYSSLKHRPFEVRTRSKRSSRSTAALRSSPLLTSSPAT